MSSDVSSNYSQDNINLPNLNNGDIYKFESFRLDASHLMLYKNGTPVSLAPKVVETLVALIERRGGIVSKQELMNRLWKDSFVEESNLTQNIYLLRKTLGKDRNGNDLIETFRRRGYRFSGEIQREVGQTEETEVSEEISATSAALAGFKSDLTAAPENRFESAAFKWRKRKKIYYVTGIISCFLIFTGIFAWRAFLNSSAKLQDQKEPDIKLTRLTPDIYAYNPAISPDGKFLAYVEVKDGKNSVWIKDIILGTAAQLLPPISNNYKALQFSPDGSELYYLTRRENVPNSIIARVPVAGNSLPREIADNAISPFAVSPDNRQLAFINGQGFLVLVNTDGSGVRILKKRENGKWFNGWDSEMSFSPDGEKIAVCGGYVENGENLSELIEISAADGHDEERRLKTPPDWRDIGGVIWLGNGKDLLVTARVAQGQPSQIWKLSYSEGTANRITKDLNDYNYISVSGDGRLLVAEQWLGNLNIWAAETENLQNIRQLTFGKAAKDGLSGIAVMPGGKIVYSSISSGNIDLWQIDAADGGNQRRLTVNAGVSNSRPQVSADGRYIVFASSRTGASHIWRMDSDGGNPKQLTFSDGYETRPNISPDDAWVFYTTDEGSEQSFIQKVPIEGGASVRVSAHNLAWGAVVSPDGKLIVYNHNEKNSPNPWKVAIMKASGGDPVKTFDLAVYAGILGWTADSKSILYINGEGSNIWQQPIDGGEPRLLTNFKSGRIVYFAFSNDYKHIIYSGGDFATEAVLISNF